MYFPKYSCTYVTVQSYNIDWIIVMNSLIFNNLNFAPIFIQYSSPDGRHHDLDLRQSRINSNITNK